MNNRHGGFLASWRKYYAIARISMQAKLAHPADQFSEIIFFLLFFSVLFFFQQATSQVATPTQSEGLTFVQCMWILFFVNIFGQRKKGISHTLSLEIQSGQIAYRLNRPCSYILFHYAEYIGDRIASLLFTGLAAALATYFCVGTPPLSLLSLTLGMIMLFAGATISFFIQLCIGLLAFWIEHVEPLRWIYWQAQSVAGGAVIPLALFPQSVKKIVLLLPFANTFYGGARIIVSFNVPDLIFYGTLQLFWLCATIIFAHILFRKGMKHVVIGGG